MTHVILEKSFRYTPKTNHDSLFEYHFDNKRGMWVNNIDKKPLVRSVNGPKPTSKKCDVETGEDRKGE